MKRLQMTVLAALSVLAVLPLAPHGTRGQTPSPAQLRRSADRHYAEKSYALALKEYRQLLPRVPHHTADHTQLEYQIGVALGKSQKWDEAFAAWDTFLAAHKGNALWTARAQYQRGLLLQTAPHEGYKVGTRLYRRGDYPHTDSAERPEYVELTQEDARDAVKAFETAVAAYEHVPVAPRHSHAGEETDLCFDLAKMLPQTQPWGSTDDWKAAKGVDWAIAPGQSYRPKWPSPKKVRFLLARIPRLSPADAHSALLARFADGLYVAQTRASWARREYVALGDDEGTWKIVQTLPYYKLDPITLLDRAAKSAPRDPQAPQVLLLAAQWTASGGDFVRALTRDRALLARYPQSRWAVDAQAAIAETRRPQLSLSTPGPQPAGSKAVVTIGSRNLKALTLTAYSVPLDAVLTETHKLNDPDNSFTRFDRNFGTVSAARALGRRVAAWRYDPRDKGNFKPHQESIQTPLSAPGAYIVEADGDRGRTRGAAVVLVSDLAVVKKTDKDTVLCYVADARSGQPVPGAKVVVRETYSENNHNHVQVSRGQTDAEGIYSAPRPRRPNVDSGNIEAFAYTPGHRYALTNAEYASWNTEGNAGNRDEIKAYAYTDRPVYRPKQTVSFRDLLAKRRGGSDYTPLVGVPVTIVVNSPKGEEIYKMTLMSSRFGSVSGSFPLPNGAPLGEYTVSVSVPSASGSVNDAGGNRFRVEEYKKPEYEVKVTPSTMQARFGDKVTATVSATLYSGPPVAGAKVSYKVFRSPFAPQYHFPQPYDWFYHNWDDGDYANQNADQGEVVTRGEGTTDARGNLSVTFVADKGTRGYDGDYAYTIKADVTDASRRQITGEGVLKVSHQPFYAYLNVPNGFYHRGDTVQIELRAQDANATPIAQTGTLTVSRITYATGSKEIATPVFTQSVTTDADGKAFTTWHSEQSGQYRVEWAAALGQDKKKEEKVVAQAPVWVEGDDLNNRSFRVGGITVLPDKTTYGEGDTAHLLIVTDQPDDWVLLTQETGNQILKRSVLHLTGRARVVDVPIVRAHVPNFGLGLVAVRDYQFFQWQQELFVPPARQFTHLTVTGDKAEYRPGDTGVFHVKATDYLNHPVASEVSLAVIDSSVFYIQKEYAPDIRLFYYGERRSINVSAESSQEAQMPGSVESDLPPLHFKPHGIVLPDFGRVLGQFYSPYYNGKARFQVQVSNREAGTDGADFASISAPQSSYTNGNVYFNNTNGIQTYDAAGMGGYPGGGPVPASPAARPETIAPMPARHAIVVTAPFAPPYAAARVRDFFPDTAFWTPAVVTNAADGTATLKVTFPDTLTSWKATARGLTTGVQVGAGETDVITNKHLLVRLEAPRFFVERDHVTLSAIVRNDLATAKTVRVSLTTDPEVLETAPPSLGAGGASSRLVTIPAGGEKRVDWTARVVGSGQADVRMTAESDEESDAVHQTFPALAYGVQKFVANSGVLQSNQTSARLTINVPTEHKPGASALLVQLNPSLAATTLDALPYLADYPYGCVEQTMSRFLPSVVVARTLRDAGVSLDTLHKRALAMQARETKGTPFGQAKPTDDSTDQTGYTYPTGTPGVMKTPQLAEGLWHADRWDNPVFDPARLHDMVTEGLSALVSMQRSDGGWGWWTDSAESDAYMSAYVVYGLATAKASGVAVPPRVLSRGFDYLAQDLKDRDDQPDLAVWESFALSHKTGPLPASARRVLSAVYAKREKLSAYGQALLALTLHNTGQNAQATVVCRNLQNTAIVDAGNGTATWKPKDQYWWSWYNNETETASWVLKAYVAILPKSELTPMLVKWLVQNKRGSAWHSTKETAMAVFALSDYIRANNELAPDYTITVALGNKLQRTFKINRDNALLFDNQFLVPDTLLPGGPATVTITKQGTGRLYYASALQYVTTEENIKGVGQELQIRRRYFRLTPKLKSNKDYAGGTFSTLDYSRTELADGAALHSGDLLDVELVLDSKNEYDYCCFEDMKPAGCEPVELRSGHSWADGLCSNMELRDTKTAFFVDHLPQGTRVLRYRLRAEVPGTFHALPTNGYAMYAPEVRALSDSWQVSVGE